MKFGIRINRSVLIQTGIFFVAALIMFFWAGTPVWYLLAFPAAFFLIGIIQIDLKGVFKGIGWLWTIALFLAGPVFTTYCIQYTILEPELFRKTKKKVWRLNVLMVLCIYLISLILIAEARYAMSAAHVLCMLAAFADYFVYEFRQNEISFADIKTIGTGLSVAKSYRFELHPRGALVLLLSVLAISLVMHCRMGYPRVVRWFLRGTGMLCMAVMIPYISSSTAKIATQTWEKKGTYKNGFVLNFYLSYGDSKVDPPEGYSSGQIRNMELLYGAPQEEDETGLLDEEEPFLAEQDLDGSGTVPAGNDNTETVPGGSEKTAVKPTIITIMDESFADFRVLGDFEASEEIMPFIDSLTENTVKGYALASVFGAKTPNSEWEYMTGNTMAFLSDGSVVYEQYLGNTPTSIVSELKNQGYTTVAMHPYLSTGWKRSTVYPKLGFDEMHFQDDGYFDETKLMRKYITDQELFDKIIGRYEEKDPDEPMFFMTITMQNHGGYKEEYDNFTSDVTYMGGRYKDADQYISLCHQTDLAVENLINYFSSVDEPVVIVFFGDHLPSLQTPFFRSVNGKGISGLTLTQLQALFSVPFFIWTNYDSEEAVVEHTSLNFLSTMALKQAGLELSPWREFLCDLQEHIPAMNCRAFYSAAKKKYFHYEDAEGEDLKWITCYQMLQYNEMFDRKGRSSWFFPYLNDAS